MLAKTQIDLEGTRLSEVSQTRNTNTIWCYEEPKMYNKLVNITTKKSRLPDIEDKLVVTSEETKGGTI